LFELENIYANVKNYHLTVEISNEHYKPSYSLQVGKSELHNYGINMAKISGLPLEIITEAKNIQLKFMKK